MIMKSLSVFELSLRSTLRSERLQDGYVGAKCSSGSSATVLTSRQGIRKKGSPTMRQTETKWGYLARCIAVSLVLWLSLITAGDQKAAPSGKCSTAVTNPGPALSADNTIYTMHT